MTTTEKQHHTTITIKPAKGGRVATWTISCSDHGRISTPEPVREKGTARRYAASHGLEAHDKDDVTYLGAFGPGVKRKVEK